MRKALAVGALVALLTACTSGANPKPGSLPTPRVSTSSTSPTPTPPVMPEAAKAPTPHGAELFVKAWVRALNYATATGMVDAVANISSSRCASCQGILGTIRRTYGGGGRIDSAGWSITDSAQPASPTTVETTVNQSAQDVYGSDSDEPQHYDGGDVRLTFRLRYTKRGWLLEQLDRHS